MLFNERWIPNRYDNTIMIDFMSTDEAKKFNRTWDTLKAIVPKLTEDDLTKIISVITDLCSNCHNDDHTCICARDE